MDQSEKGGKKKYKKWASEGFTTTSRVYLCEAGFSALVIKARQWLKVQPLNPTITV